MLYHQHHCHHCQQFLSAQDNCCPCAIWSKNCGKYIQLNTPPSIHNSDEEEEVFIIFFFFWVLGLPCLSSDIRFVKNFTPPDFQAKNFTPLISPNFNSFGDKNTKKMSRNGEIYTTGKNGSDGSDKSHLCSSCGNEFLFQYSLLVQIARSSLFVIMFCNSPESCKMQLMWAISIAAKWGAKKFCLICLYCLVI